MAYIKQSNNDHPNDMLPEWIVTPWQKNEDDDFSSNPIFFSKQNNPLRRCLEVVKWIQQQQQHRKNPFEFWFFFQRFSSDDWNRKRSRWLRMDRKRSNPNPSEKIEIVSMIYSNLLRDFVPNSTQNNSIFFPNEPRKKKFSFYHFWK